MEENKFPFEEEPRPEDLPDSSDIVLPTPEEAEPADPLDDPVMKTLPDEPEDAPVEPLWDSVPQEVIPEVIPEAMPEDIPQEIPGDPAPEQDADPGHLLEEPVISGEILPDEVAIATAGLTHPSDVELEKIMQEALSQDWTPQPAQEEDSLFPQEPYRDEEYADGFPEEPEDGAGGDFPPDDGDEDEYEYDEPDRKRRPKRKKGYGLFGLPHILVTVIWLAIVVILGVSLGRFLWVCVDDVMAFSRGDQEVVITVEDTDTIEDIAQKLHDNGLIRYPGLFKLYAQVTDAREDISSGTFTLNTMYDYHALVSFMTTYSAFRTVVKVQIPEGYTCAQIFALMEEKDVCTAAALEEYAANGELDEYWFLAGVERGTPYCLEGFLFPDTYEFYTKDEPRRVLEKLLDDFDYRFNESMIETIPLLNERLSQMMAANGLDETYIAEHQMDVRKIVTIASMIERETSGSLESYTISSVIYNRLTNAANYPYLNIDAALYYALEEGHGALTYEDLAIDSPYNTYKYPGLIPGPIANPGLDSLLAALDPESTDYYFYALNPATGTHHFSRNISEHESFLASISEAG